MNTAVAEIEPTPLAPANPLLLGFSRLDTGKKLMLVLGALALVGVVLAAIFMGRQPDWRVLYANISDKDGGAVLARLSQMGVPYKHAEGGAAILVPADKVHDTRLKLASEGLPKGSVVGFELMDATRLGVTQFQERLNFQRGLEGELVRSITALSSVADARVHLALPNPSGFFREQQKPSASVLVTLRGGRSLDRTQVAGIVHLVSSSVPEMNPRAVSVVDQNGALLSQPPEGEPGSVDAQQLDYTRQVEQHFAKRVLDLLEPLVGRENVRAQVTADIDFSLTEQTSEQHKPNQGGEPGAVRSQQLIEAGSATSGVTNPAAPGSVANQPPAATTAAINGQAGKAGITTGANNTGTGGGDSSSRRESVINYEVDKTVRVTRGASGTVRRLNAAVVINHTTGKDAKGNATSAPLPAEQIEQINKLVREAIGFNQDRGDSVNVMNAPFTKTSFDNGPELPWWKLPETQDLARSLVWPVGTLLLGLMLFFGLVRPAIKMMQAPPVRELALAGAGAGAGGGLDAVLDDQPQRPALPTPMQNEVTAEMLRLEDAKRLARENPMAVANIIKTWINGEGAQGGAPA